MKKNITKDLLSTKISKPSKNSELNLSLDELKKSCTEMQNELIKMKIQHTLGPIENNSKIRNLRRSIARSKTKIHMMENVRSGNE